MRSAALSLACVFVVALAVSARADKPSAVERSPGNPQAVVFDAPAAFEFFKTMVGKWEHVGGHDHGGASRESDFRLTAGGSSVMETIFPGDPSEMLTVYHMDGDDLLLTHYCALHNAPVLKFQKSDKPGEIKFVFAGGTNFDPKADTHVHEGTFRVKDANTLETSFVTFSDGKSDANIQGILKRKASK